VAHGQYLPPDPSKGDESTVAGYAAVHARPAALEGRDGFSYSIEILSDSTSDSTGDPVEPIGAYLMFVQWSRLGAQKVEGHVESEFLAWGASAGEAEGLLGAMKLAAAQEVLDGLLRTRDGASTRRWWSATDAASEAGADGSGAH
jgi:hypothetical protein